MTKGSGASGGRTHMVLLPKDFKSFASADSAIAPAVQILPYILTLQDFVPLSKAKSPSSDDLWILRRFQPNGING